MFKLHIQYCAPSRLTLRPSNPRTHTPKQLQQIAASIQRFGFTNPILIDREHRVIAGHGRLQAAKLLGLAEVPTICLEELTDAEIRAYVIADNRLAELAGWDQELLAVEFEYLSSLEHDFDLTITGFELPEIDYVIQGQAPKPSTADDAVPDPDRDKQPVTQIGDLWRIGAHRLLCADATVAESYPTLLEGKLADLVFTDPPYNVPIEGHASGLGRMKHRNFAMAAGEMTKEEFTGFLKRIFEQLVAHSRPGSIHFVCMDWRHLSEILAAGNACYTELKNLCVWAKTNAGMGSLYRSQHELVLVFKSGIAPHVNQVALGQYGRYRTNVWSYAGVNSFGKDRQEALHDHPTVKPVSLIADALLDCSRRGDHVLDPFVGSGSTLVAAHRTSRMGFGMEIDPHYCDVTIRRLENITGESAIHARLRLSFKEIADLRASPTGRAA